MHASSADGNDLGLFMCSYMAFVFNFLDSKHLACILTIGSSGDCQYIFRIILSDLLKPQDTVKENSILFGTMVYDVFFLCPSKNLSEVLIM